MCPAVSSTSWSSGAPRRAVLLGAAGLGLAGCGFRPLYAPVAVQGGGEEDIRAELAAVRVATIPERFGQQLRRELVRRFEGSAPGTAGRYLLTVAVSLSAEILGYRRDGTISRVRYAATGNWNLATQEVPPVVLGRSVLPYRTIDSFNVPDLQFFAADTAREAMERRLVEIISEEVFREVAIVLRRRRETGSSDPAGATPPR